MRICYFIIILIVYKLKERLKDGLKRKTTQIIKNNKEIYCFMDNTMNNISTANKMNAGNTNEMQGTEKKKIRLKVLTPTRVVYDKPVNMIIARTVDGDIGILYGHDPRTALLDYGILQIFNDKDDNTDRREEEILMVLGGILTVKNNEAVILSDIAEHPDKLQEFINKLQEERSAHKIEEQTTDLAMRRMEFAIRHALVHMDVSAYSILQGRGEQEKSE